MYAPSAWTPLPTGHGPLGLASLQKGQVTPAVRTDTNHQQKAPRKNLSASCVDYATVVLISLIHSVITG